MSTLRAQVEALPTLMREAFGGDLRDITNLIDREAVLALIPEDAVLVTRESLAAALPGWMTEYPKGMSEDEFALDIADNIIGAHEGGSSKENVDV